MANRVVDREEDVKAIDNGVKNAWRWCWLEKMVEGDYVRHFIRKIRAPGLARCELCSKDISYGSRGFKNIEQHMLKKLHRDNLKLRSSNYSLSGKSDT